MLSCRVFIKINLIEKRKGGRSAWCSRLGYKANIKTILQTKPSLILVLFCSNTVRGYNNRTVGCTERTEEKLP